MREAKQMNPNDHYLDDEIDLMELLGVLWSGKRLISLVTTMAALISVVMALSMPNIFSSSALLVSAEQSGGGMSGLMKQYGGLASLAGVSFTGGAEADRTQLGITLMQSRGFIGDFVERRNILPELMATKSWDMLSGDINFDLEIYNPETGEWVRKVSPHQTSKPSALESHRAFSEILSVTKDTKTGYVTVSIEHMSPIIAAQWVNWLVEDVNATMKDRDVEEATKSIEYLKQQIANTSLAELQAVFFKLIQSQTETAMLAEVRSEYVFKTIDPAVVAEEKSKPSRTTICILGTLIGGGLGILIVLINHYIRSKNNNEI